MSLRAVEELVAHRQRGDLPDDPERIDVRPRTIRLEVDADAYAQWCATRARMHDEDGRRLDDSAFVRAVCAQGDARACDAGRARHQIGIQVCPGCKRAWQDGGGARVEIDAARLERAECDAQHIGSLDGDKPERAIQTIPPATVRFVWRRDHGACRVPGCRSARGLEIHHLAHRENGGGHAAENLILVCSACHQAHHRGDLKLSGTAKDVRVERDDAQAPPSTSRAGRHASEARLALTTLGFPSRVAEQAVTAAIQRVPDAAELEVVIREALRTAWTAAASRGPA